MTTFFVLSPSFLVASSSRCRRSHAHEMRHALRLWRGARVLLAVAGRCKC
jgi:hypothetical protein